MDADRTRRRPRDEDRHVELLVRENLPLNDEILADDREGGQPTERRHRGLEEQQVEDARIHASSGSVHNAPRTALSARTRNGATPQMASANAPNKEKDDTASIGRAQKRSDEGPARAHHDGDGARQSTAKGELCERVLCPRRIEGGQRSGQHRAGHRDGHQRDHRTHRAPHQPTDPGAERQHIRARRQPRDSEREMGLATIQPVLPLHDLFLEDRYRRSAATEDGTPEPSEYPRDRADGRTTRESGGVGRLELRGGNGHDDRSLSRLAARVNSLAHGHSFSRSATPKPRGSNAGNPEARRRSTTTGSGSAARPATCPSPAPRRGAPPP